MQKPSKPERNNEDIVHHAGHGSSSLAKETFTKRSEHIAKIYSAIIDFEQTPYLDIFDNKFRINFHDPIHWLDTNYASAFRTTKRIDNENSYYTLICSASHPPRLSQLQQFQTLKTLNMVLPLGWDLIEDDAKKQYPIVLFALPQSEPLIQKLTMNFQPQAPIICMQRFLQPILSTINELHTIGATYRAFSPTNLFIDLSGNVQRDYMLGQCISDPPGTMQHTVFETISAGMANNDYRGKELSSNDTYALGVMMVCLMRGSIPMAHMDDIEISRRKLSLSSFSALTEGLNVPINMKDPLRGMLADNVNERWTLERIYGWLSGRQGEKKVRIIKSRSRMSFHYHHQSFNTSTELAAFFANSWNDSVEQTINPDIPIWIRHGVADEATSNYIRDLQSQVSISGGMASRYDANLHIAFAKMLFLMNPHSPIVFQDLRFTMTGFGQLFAQFFAHPNSAEMIQLKSVISTELIQYWYRHQKSRSTIYNSIIQEIALARQAITLERLEFGFERMLYTLYPDLPCLSPIFHGKFVFDLATFLDALEEKLSMEDPETYQFLVDRHMISYIGTRIQRNLTGVLRIAMDMHSELASKKAQIILLSVLQEDFSPRPFPILCQYACGLLETALMSYHNTKLRNRLRTRLYNTAKIGWLNQLIDVIEDGRLLRTDNSNYAQARTEYARNANILSELARTKEHVNDDVKTRSNRYTLIVCLSISALGVIILLFG